MEKHTPQCSDLQQKYLAHKFTDELGESSSVGWLG
jgi:hypothetical protein